jgi:hypothetical protein
MTALRELRNKSENQVLNQNFLTKLNAQGLFKSVN